jgi:hypothetical protein
MFRFKPRLPGAERSIGRRFGSRARGRELASAMNKGPRARP